MAVTVMTKRSARNCLDVGVNHETLRQWVKDPAAVAKDATDAEISRLHNQVRELETEREIARRAAKYFARETGW